MSLLKRMKDRIVGEKPNASQIADRDPVLSAEEYVEQAWLCRKKSDWAGAVNNYSKAIACDPDCADAFYGRGVVYCIVDHNEQAVVDLDRALELRPNDAMAMTERGLAYSQLGNNWQAQEDLEDAILIDPAYYPAHVNLGNLYGQQESFSDALMSHNMAVKLAPKNWDNYLRRGGVLAALGEHRLAYEDFTTYLQHNARGAHSEIARHNIENLSAYGEYEPAGWSAQRWMWSEFVYLDLSDTVSELINKVQTSNAYYVVVPLANEQYALESVYGRLGLRLRLTEIADVIGRKILQLRLEQLLDLWKPCPSVGLTVTEEQAKQACEQNNGCALVQESGRIIGILETKNDYVYPHYSAVLFGKEYAFYREGRTLPVVPFRQCRHCDELFAYYGFVLDDDKLVDYVCPQCIVSPISDWAQERMRPGEFSESGFLGVEESLVSVIARDKQTLSDLGVTCEQIADALDSLLDAASIAIDDQIVDWLERERRFGEALAAQIAKDGLNSVLEKARKEPPKRDNDQQFGSMDVESLLNEGELPPADIGSLIDGYQVFLSVYRGYQYCPWTALRRPWSKMMPAPPVSVGQRGGLWKIDNIPGQSLLCQDGNSYRYADRDFLILDRESGQYLKGPGLIVHLIRDHHFFEGVDVPYRVDPEQAARVLKLI